MGNKKRFDFNRSYEAKEHGMLMAKTYREEVFIKARQAAIKIGRQKRYVTADDVYLYLINKKENVGFLGPAAGSIFRMPCFRFTGRWVASKRVSNHARQNRVWEFTG